MAKKGNINNPKGKGLKAAYKSGSLVRKGGKNVRVKSSGRRKL